MLLINGVSKILRIKATIDNNGIIESYRLLHSKNIHKSMATK